MGFLNQRRLCLVYESFKEIKYRKNGKEKKWSEEENVSVVFILVLKHCFLFPKIKKII